MLKLFKKEIWNVEWWQCKKKSLVGSDLREHGQGGVYAVFKDVFESMFITIPEVISGSGRWWMPYIISWVSWPSLSC